MGDERQYPRHDRTRWELVMKGPFSASGCDEVFMTAEFKYQLQRAAERKQFGRNSVFEIRRIQRDES